MSIRIQTAVRAACASLLFCAGIAAHAQSAAPSDVPTGRLPRDVEPRETALELKLDPRKQRFEGRTRIAVDVKKSGDTLWLHGRDLTIESASITADGGEQLPLKAEQADVSGVLKFTAPSAIPAGKATVEIVYSAPYGQLQGAYKVRPDGNDYVVTQMEPLGARNTFPGFDEPGFKTPWDVTLIVPQDQAAVANTRQIKEEQLDGGWKKLTFARTENLPSYLIAFAVGPWDVVEWKDIPPNAIRATPLKLRGIAAKGQGPRMAYALEHTAEIVQALEEYFGTPYPFDKLDLVAAPDFWAGAMENAGLIVYRDSLMFADENSPTELRQAYWGVHAHELAHQWFGNLVTMPWWDDLWLNEAFATWMGNRITGRLKPEFHTDRGLMEGALGAMGGDSLASTRRIHEPVHDFTDIQSAFDGITYQKGGAVLAMFERYVGETKFRDAVRAYLKKHARGNATSADLINAIAANSDDPEGVRAAFDSFIDQPGVPLVRAELDCTDASKPALRIAQSRFLPLGSQAAGGQHWGLPLCLRFEAGGEKHRQCALVGEPQARVPLQTSRCPAWVMPNAEGAGYYRFALADKDRPALDAAFTKLDEREQRAYADSLGAAFQAGAISPGDYLTTVPRLAAAPVRQTVASTFGQLGWMIEHLAGDDAARAPLRGFAAKAYRPRLDALGLEPKPGETDDDRLLRGDLAEFIAGTAKEPALRDELARRGRAVLGLAADGRAGDGKLHENAVSADLRGLVLVVAAQQGDAATFDAVLGHLRTTQDPTLRGQLVSALGSFTDPALARRARALALEQGLLRRNELFPLLMSQTGEESLRAGVREWLDANFKLLEARLAPAGAALVNLYAAGMCSAQDADHVQKRFEQRMRTIEGGPRRLAQTAENLRLCAALRDAQIRRGFGSALN